jgi:hypothetical protein
MHKEDQNYSMHGMHDVPLFPGFLRAYRSWDCDCCSENDGWLTRILTGRVAAHLESVYVGSHCWRPGVNAAQCAQFGTRFSATSVSEMLAALYPPGRRPKRCFWDMRPNCRWAPDGNGAAGLDCQCGFYGTHGDFPSDYIYTRSIHGSFKATGRVILGKKGIRAEKAEVEALVGGGKHAGDLADRFGVPLFRTRAALLKKFPPMSDVVGSMIDG